jgi:transposase
VASSRNLVRRASRSRFREKKGLIEELYTHPPEDSAVVCLDEMGPESAKSFPGQQLVHAQPRPNSAGQAPPAERAQQEIDYGRRGKGYIFGAFRPATGEAFTRPYGRRSAANWADFLAQVEGWLPAEVTRVYAIVDNLSAHRATDVLLFGLAYARWEFVFQPKYAAYLNLIEPWWKVLRSLALKGRRFETWEGVCHAIAEATAYWNGHRHPFVWGRRRRHQPRRQPGIAAAPGVSSLAGCTT